MSSLSGPFLKSEAPAEFVEALTQLESRADRGSHFLDIYRFQRNIAIWGALTKVVAVIEGIIYSEGQRSKNLTAAMINLGKAAPLLIDWVKSNAHSKEHFRRRFVWTNGLAKAADHALQVAHHYSAFRSLFPMWHRDRVTAELLDSNTIRFAAVGNEFQTRVRAYQQDIRPKNYSGALPPEPSVALVSSQEVNRQLVDSMETWRREGSLGFKYQSPGNALRLLFQIYSERLSTLMRRNEAAVLGDYNLATFKTFYAALLSMCAVHELACFLWSQRSGKFPLNSAVLVLSKTEWIARLARTSGLTEDVTMKIVSDLTLGGTRHLDLHVQPFVPLTRDSALIAVVPHFPLKSNTDENILRTCSYVRPQFFDVISSAKEEEMRSDLVAKSRIPSFGPFQLPKPLPDVDLVLADNESSTVVICELKWIRKTLSVLEHIDRERDLMKGIDQLRKIKNFLESHPDHLSRFGLNPLTDFENIYYVLVARDYLRWIDPRTDFPLIEHEPLKRILTTESTLKIMMEELLTFEWLPKEGRDFHVRHETANVNGVAVQSELFFAA